MELAVKLAIFIVCIAVVVFFGLGIYALIKIAGDSDRQAEEWERRQQERRMELKIEQQARRGLKKREEKVQHIGADEKICLQRGDQEPDGMGQRTGYPVQHTQEQNRSRLELCGSGGNADPEERAGKRGSGEKETVRQGDLREMQE